MLGLAMVFILFFILVPYNNAQLISVYSDDFKKGKHEEINISKCSNFSPEMAGEVTSIDSKGHCARFFDEVDCKGESIEMMPRSPFHGNLHWWGFNDRAKSVSQCRHECSPEITGSLPEVPIEVMLFAKPSYKGAYTELRVQGCTLVPAGFVSSSKSVKTGGQCIQIYNNIQCEARGSNRDSIELRSGTPAHDDLGNWAFYDAKAVSHCAYKCNGSKQGGAINSHDNSTPLKPDEVILYDSPNFQGNMIRLQLKQCLNLDYHWQGVAESVKTHETSCVTLYDRRNCQGESLQVAPQREDLTSRNFDGLTRSIQPCHPQEVIPSSNGPRSSNSSKSHQFNGGKNDGQGPGSSTTITPTILAIIIVVPLFGVALSVFLVLFIVRKCNPYKDIMSALSEKEIEEFLRGLGLDTSQSRSNGDDYSVELLAQNNPYNDAYEVPRSKIKFDTKSPLGMGEFGVVYKGSIIDDNDKEALVAVKTLKPNASIYCLRSLLKEVKVMLYVGRHDRVVQMVGCCTENLRKGEIFVLMEFCHRGSLESYLTKNRSCYRNIVKKGRIDPELQAATEYQNFDSGGAEFDIFQLIKWCIHIAEGMEFLSSRKVIHSDLAARNILLSSSFEAKISDFGLSKQLYCYTQYVKKQQEPLPWRWLALESLKNFEFSTQSDVWGFGVLCWEIFTLGDKPYPGITWSSDFIRDLEDGLRLSKPKLAVTECYNLMIQCWYDEPSRRPDFSEILAELRDIHDGASPTSTMPVAEPSVHIAMSI